MNMWADVSGIDVMESEKVAEAVSNSTQTLEEGCCPKEIPAKVLIVRKRQSSRHTGMVTAIPFESTRD